MRKDVTKIAPTFHNDVFGWTRRCRIATFDGYQPPLYPDRNYDAVNMVKIASELDANTIRISAMGKLAHFKTEQWEVDEYIKSHDFLRELIDMAHAAGIKVVVYTPGAHPLPLDLLKKWHPEWIQRTAPPCRRVSVAHIGGGGGGSDCNEGGDGSGGGSGGNGGGGDESAEKYQYHSGTLCGRVCPIGPYKDFYRSMLEAVIINCDVDGWYTDGWKVHYFDSVCYCESCREQFFAETGEDIYAAGYQPGGVRFPEIADWYHRMVVKTIQEAHVMVWNHKRLPSMINHIGGILGYEKHAPWADEVDSMHDVMHFERMTEPYSRLAAASYASALGQRAWFYAGVYSNFHIATPDTAGADFAEKNYADERIYPFRKELYNECLIPLACGQGVNSYRCNSLFFDADSRGKRMIADIFSMVKRNPEVFEDTDYYCFAGVLNPEVSRSNFQGDQLKALVRQGIQATIIKKEDLSNLTFMSKFAVIVADGLSAGDQNRMLDYVRSGGRWVTNGEIIGFAKSDAAMLECPEGIKGFAYGRGIVVQACACVSDNAHMVQDVLLEAVAFAAGNYLPYRVTIPSGELIPILSAKKGLWALHLVNISKHLTGFHECGLEDIPPIENVRIEINLGDEPMPKSIRLLRSEAVIDPKIESENRYSNVLRMCLPRLDEYEAIVLKWQLD